MELGLGLDGGCWRGVADVGGRVWEEVVVGREGGGCGWFRN